MDLLYQISERKDVLLRLCITWEHDLQACPKDRTLPSWGPSQEELAAMKAQLSVEALDNGDDDEEEEEGVMSEFEDEAIDDAGLIERLDTFGLYTVLGDDEVEEVDESSADDWEDMD